MLLSIFYILDLICIFQLVTYTLSSVLLVVYSFKWKNLAKSLYAYTCHV